MMKYDGIAGKIYLVFGFGKTGQAAARFLQDNEAFVYVWDDKDSSRHLAQQAGYKTNDPATINFQTLKALVLAPGIPLSHKIVEKAQLYGVPVINDLHFLFSANPEATYVGITGTNGKSTTTALITHILREAGRKVQMGGNIGTAALDLKPMGKDDICVLELSSYQLDLIKEHPISVAVILNLTPDHLAHHGDMASYVAAKANIIQTEKPQTFIIGTDDEELIELCGSVKKTCPNLKLQEIAHSHPVDYGLHIEANKITFEGREHKSIDLTYCKTLRGVHNAQNAAAAFAACEALGLSTEDIEKGLRSFLGLPHRQQLVATLESIRFVNDSKATNAHAAAKALSTYPNIYWIVGGRAKQTGLDGLEALLDNVSHAFLIGESEDRFASWCEGKLSFTRCKTLDKALEKATFMARQITKIEDVNSATVLLSPACASWDQFDSFEHRGETFIQLVHELTTKGS